MMKRFVGVCIAASMLLAPWKQADACTGITLTAKDSARVVARTIEWGGSELNSQYVIVPRGHTVRSYVPGYYSYTAYFASVDIPTIQAHADTIWLADYRANYNKDIPRDMHQYTSSGTVAGITGRVDCNNLFRDFPGEISKEDKPMSFDPITGKVLRCTSAENPKCETFNSADINDSLGVLELDKTYTITARGGTIQLAGMTGTWYKIIADGAEVYCLELPDGRCVVEDAPAAGTPAVDLTEVLAALARIEKNQSTQGRQLTALEDKLIAAGAALAGEGAADG